MDALTGHDLARIIEALRKIEVAIRHSIRTQSIHVVGNGNDVKVAGHDLEQVEDVGHDRHEPASFPSSQAQTSRGLAFWIRPRQALASGFGLTIVVGGLLRIFVIGSPLMPPSHWPAGAMAQCNDRWISSSVNHSGTCAAHGGVAYWRFPSEIAAR